MAILKYLGMVLYAARAAQTNTERTPRVPLVSIRELHEDFSGKVEDATCLRNVDRLSRSATRTTTVRRTPTTSAATRTGASSRGRRVIAHSAGPFLLLLLSSFLPAPHMVTKTESTNEYRSTPSPKTG